MATIVAVILLVLSPALGAQAPPKGSGPIEIMGPVRVIDGDTLELYLDGHQTAIGIVGIKAPRANTACGQKAAELIQQLVSTIDGREAPVKLRFEEDPIVTFDARHRRMYRLVLPDGSSAAHTLVKAGLAEPDGTGEDSAALDLARRTARKCTD
jgi:endonuclease YncB( thermonuclease family)